MRQILRGAGYLPHAGSHPGWPFLLVMIAAGCAAGAQGSGTTIGAAVGAVLMTLIIGPMFAIGCVGRANLNDRIESKQQREIAT